MYWISTVKIIDTNFTLHLQISLYIYFVFYFNGIPICEIAEDRITLNRLLIRAEKGIAFISNEYRIKFKSVKASSIYKSMLNTRFLWSVRSKVPRTRHTLAREMKGAWKRRAPFKGALQSNRRRFTRQATGRQNIQTLRTRSRRIRNIITAFGRAGGGWNAFHRALPRRVKTRSSFGGLSPSHSTSKIGGRII